MNLGAKSGVATRIRNVFLTLVAVAVVTMLVIHPAPGETPATGEDVVGQAGTDTRLPRTDSEVTVSGHDQFADLKITVNQTKDLGNQAISVSWTGGKPTLSGGTAFAGNYLQLMQCWGDDDGTNSENPGPPPEQCVFGAQLTSDGLFPPGSYANHRIVSFTRWPSPDVSDGILDESTGWVWKPFRAINGTEVSTQFNARCNEGDEACSYWLNPSYNRFTTNEVAGVKTSSSGQGAALFEVATGIEQSGLGCGQVRTTAGGGVPRMPKCWLVIVPRADQAYEHEGTGLSSAQGGVMTSPLAAHSWANRIAIPLEFRPLEASCDFSQDARQIAGSELAAIAVSSWQPKVCTASGAAAYAYATVGDGRARQQLLAKTFGSPGMAVVSKPIDPSFVDPEDPVVYAPLTLSATVIGFNVERSPKDTAPLSANALAGVRVAEINLTPRLVAKLLTQSYSDQVSIKTLAPYEWAKTNPRHLALDQDFLQFNPEFSILRANTKNFGGLILPAGNADHIQRLWEYIFADPEAKSWLDGEADPWGMRVNPVYAATAAANSRNVAFGDPVPELFPKSDAFCYQGPPHRSETAPADAPLLTPPLLCGNDWMPYASTLQEASRRTRAADDSARTVYNAFALTTDRIWMRDGPHALGSRSMLSITDSASAARYGVQMARLSRAGDNEPGRKFVAADVEGMTTAVGAMSPRDEPQVLEPDPKAQVAGAYPLTHLTYGAITPLSQPEQHRQQFGVFLDYTAGSGQVPGSKPGQLPPGYAPLPPRLQSQAMDAAEFVRHGVLARGEDPAEEGASDSPSVAPAGGTPPAAGDSARSSSPGSGAQASPGPVRSGLPGMELPVPIVSQPVSNSNASTGSSASSGLATPILALARNRFALPVLATIALLAAWGALEMSKRPRMVPPSEPNPFSDVAEVP